MIPYEDLTIHPKERLGRGGFGIVCNGEYRKIPVAIKEFDDRSSFKRETGIIKQLQHLFIMRYFGISENLHKYYLIMERCEGDLKNCMENKIPSIPWSRGIIHKDLTPRKILLWTDPNKESIGSKITGFVFSKQLRPDKEEFSLSKQPGTQGFIAPEILYEEYFKPTYEMDIYSLGIVFFYVLSGGQHPFQNQRLLRDLIMKKGFPNLEPLQGRGEAVHLVSQMINRDPKQRPNLFLIPYHPFFTINSPRMKTLLSYNIKYLISLNKKTNGSRFLNKLKTFKTSEWKEKLEENSKDFLDQKEWDDFRLNLEKIMKPAPKLYKNIINPNEIIKQDLEREIVNIHQSNHFLLEFHPEAWLEKFLRDNRKLSLYYIWSVLASIYPSGEYNMELLRVFQIPGFLLLLVNDSYKMIQNIFSGVKQDSWFEDSPLTNNLNTRWELNDILQFAAEITSPQMMKVVIENVSLEKVMLKRLLINAVRNSNTEMAQFFLEKGMDLNVKDNNGRTLLHFAVTDSTVEMVQFLLNKGMDLNVKNNDDLTLLHAAVAKPSIQMVQFLLDKGMDLNVKDNNGRTILYAAVAISTIEMVQFLLDKGMNLNEKDNNGRTLLQFAVAISTFEMVQFLLAKGLDLDVKDNDGQTLLHIAVANSTIEMVQFLLDRGLDLYVEDNNGKTLFHYAVANSTIEMAQFLLAKGLDLDVKDNNGKTLLHIAVANTNIEMVQFLLAKGLDLDVKDNNGQTLLHIAVAKSNIEMVQFLLDKGMNPNVSANDRRTLVDFAVANSSKEMVQFLLDKGIHSC